MASFVVMEAPDDRDAAVYVRDGFHVWAFLFPPIWLAWHKLWIEAVLALAVMAALGTLGGVAGFGDAAPALSLLVSLYVGLEAPALQIAALRRRGWSDGGVVDAYNRDDAETKHLFGNAEVASEDAPVAKISEPELPFAPRPAQAGPALGLFSYPGSR